jgi:hypothetical protein
MQVVKILATANFAPSPIEVAIGIVPDNAFHTSLFDARVIDEVDHLAEQSA